MKRQVEHMNTNEAALCRGISMLTLCKCAGKLLPLPVGVAPQSAVCPAAGVKGHRKANAIGTRLMSASVGFKSRKQSATTSHRVTSLVNAPVP